MDLLVRIADALGRFSARYVPSSFAIAVLLTFVTFALGMTWGHAGPRQVLEGWGNGFWELLTFSMQMALVLFSGYLLALTAPVRLMLEKVASLARTPRRAVMLMALLSMALAYVNWGLSLVASAVMVRFIVRRQPEVDYRLLVACAYFGLGATWHSGLSASAPLLVATPGHFLEHQLGVLPIDTTLFSAFNLVLVAVVVIVLTVLAGVLHPRPEHTVRVDPALVESFGRFEPPPVPEERTFANLLDHSPVLNIAFGLCALAFSAIALAKGWQALNINTVNFLFLSLAILLHGTPARLLKAAEEAGSVLSGIVLQFPLYAGIYGVFKFTGLTEQIGQAFVSLGSAKTFPAIVYWYSGIVNYFVPSGGSKWAIEAPYLLQAAKTLGVAPNKVVLAYAWGDMASDLIQPFWALPLLAVAKIEFKHLLGYLFLAFLIYVPLVSAAFLWCL
ncbi:MAG: short-chain fatty acid transporter [Myxococcaceae bacterium]|nr:short-chain fatty acid transporter [Myxococcaceae bacterium]